MTSYNSQTLKTFFESGDVPQGSDYANLIDSYVNIVNTGPQSMAGALQSTELIASRVSAGNANLTGTLTVAGQTTFNGSLSLTAVSATSIAVSGKISGGSGSFTSIVSAASLNVTGDVSAATGTVYASAQRVTGGSYRTVLVVSAAGSTQATAAPLGTNGIVRLKGIVNDQTTGFILLANQTGNQQTLWIEENTSCNLWPCIGGQINALASNAAFAMTGNTQYIVTHIKASGYSVK